MISIVQRVIEASVTVDGQVVGKIGPGLLVLAAVQKRDTPVDVTWTAAKLASLRLFDSADGAKGFERDLRELGGAILLVSNFTVAAATRKGRRPSFDAAADPATGRGLFDALVQAVQAQGVEVQTGRFGADMKVSLVNDGPITVIVESPEKDAAKDG